MDREEALLLARLAGQVNTEANDMASKVSSDSKNIPIRKVDPRKILTEAMKAGVDGAAMSAVMNPPPLPTTSLSIDDINIDSLKPKPLADILIPGGEVHQVIDPRYKTQSQPNQIIPAPQTNENQIEFEFINELNKAPSPYATILNRLDTIISRIITLENIVAKVVRSKDGE